MPADHGLSVGPAAPGAALLDLERRPIVAARAGGDDTRQDVRGDEVPRIRRPPEAGGPRTLVVGQHALRIRRRGKHIGRVRYADLGIAPIRPRQGDANSCTACCVE